MDEHPTLQILKDLLLGRLPLEDQKSVVAHLLTGCPRCREEIAPTAAAMFRPNRTTTAPLAEEENDDLREQALTSACETALAQLRSLESERVEADSKIDSLLRNGKAGEREDFWTWGLCERLLERSWELRQKSPSKMVALAQHAVEAAERIDPDRYGAQHIADLSAQAWAGLSNAHRISDQLSSAETALEKAFSAFHQGTRPPLLRARLAEISASLLCDQREFPTAFRVLDFAYSLYLEHKDPHDAGRALIKKGLHSGYTGDPEDGIRLIARGLQLIDRARDSKLVFQSLHNILLFRVELGKFKSARRQIFEMRPLYEGHSDQILKTKLRWIEGKVFLGLGEFDRAIRAFQQAKDGFLQLNMNYDAALVSFELAAVWLEQGKGKEARRLLHEMLEIFRARYIAREAIAAIIMLRDAADRNELTVDLLEMIGGLFQTFQERPKEEGID